MVEPRTAGELSVYICGPTVYNFVHVGNARPFWVGQVLQRFVTRRLGWRVRLVVNITDVDDKIYRRAREEHVGSRELAARYREAYLEDTDRLGLGRPDVEPLATETVPQIVALIEELEQRGLAYAAGGDVYFRVAAFDGYGELSGQRVEDLLAGARIEPGEAKESAPDFALWKGTKPDEDASWPSPWGPGRPGWHIECSAIDPPLAEPLSRGLVFIQYRTENLRVVPVFGQGALDVSPRIGHVHLTVDDLPWHFVDASGETVILVGLPPGPRSVLFELADPTHRVIARETVRFTVPEPKADKPPNDGVFQLHAPGSRIMGKRG